MPWDPPRHPSQPASARSGATVPWERIGWSVRGKPIEAATLGSGPVRVYLLAGLRGDEPEAPAAARALAQRLGAEPIPSLMLRIVPEANPDAIAARQRTNSRGVDLWRNWPAPDYVPLARHGRFGPESEIETAALVRDLRAFEPHVVAVLGSAALGPAASMAGPGPDLAHAFASGARGADGRWRVRLMPAHIPAGSPASFAVAVLQRPALTIEFQRGRETSVNTAALAAGLAAVATRMTPAGTPPAQDGVRTAAGGP